MLQKPGSREIPVLDAVEEIIEATAIQGHDLLCGTTQGLGGKDTIGFSGAGLVDERLPDRGRDLIGGIAPEAIDTEIQLFPDIAGPEVGLFGTQFFSVVIDLTQIAPDRDLGWVIGIDGIR